MKKLLLFLIFLFILGCNKPKTVLICGDHVCVNKAEAEQYFEDNLTLEVRVIDNKAKKEIDLVELNLKSNSEGKKKISILPIDKTKKKIKILSNDEIDKKKAEIKQRKKNQIKKEKNKKILKEAKLNKITKKQKTSNKIRKSEIVVNKSSNKITDICTMLEKCSIDEISKYLIKQGKEKNFPDIAVRETK